MGCTPDGRRNAYAGPPACAGVAFLHVAVVGADPEPLAASVRQLGADSVVLVGLPDQEDAGAHAVDRPEVEVEPGTRGALTIRLTDTGELMARSLDV